MELFMQNHGERQDSLVKQVPVNSTAISIAAIKQLYLDWEVDQLLNQIDTNDDFVKVLFEQYGTGEQYFIVFILNKLAKDHQLVFSENKKNAGLLDLLKKMQFHALNYSITNNLPEIFEGVKNQVELVAVKLKDGQTTRIEPEALSKAERQQRLATVLAAKQDAAGTTVMNEHKVDVAPTEIEKVLAGDQRDGLPDEEFVDQQVQFLTVEDLPPQVAVEVNSHDQPNPVIHQVETSPTNLAENTRSQLKKLKKKTKKSRKARDGEQSEDESLRQAESESESDSNASVSEKPKRRVKKRKKTRKENRDGDESLSLSESESDSMSDGADSVNTKQQLQLSTTASTVVRPTEQPFAEMAVTTPRWQLPDESGVYFVAPIPTEVDFTTAQTFLADPVNAKIKEKLLAYITGDKRSVLKNSSKQLKKLLQEHPQFISLIYSDTYQSLLHLACESLNFAAVQVLVSLGIDVSARDRTGKTALQQLTNHGASPAKSIHRRGSQTVQAVKAITTYLANYENLPFCHAVRTFDVDLAVTMIHGFRGCMSARLSAGKTVLHLLIPLGKTLSLQERQNQLVIAKLIIANGNFKDRREKWEFINAKDNTGRNVLQNACDVGQTDLINFLLEQSVIEVNAVDENGDTALHLACLRGYFDTVTKLLQHQQINLDQINNQSNTVMHMMAMVDSIRSKCKLQKGYYEGFITLVNGQRLVNQPNKQGNTPFMLALQGGILRFAVTMTEVATIEVERTNAVANSALHLLCGATINDDELAMQLAEKLLQQATNTITFVNQTNHTMDTPLHIACNTGNLTLALKLLEVDGIRVNERNKNNDTPLHLLADYCMGLDADTLSGQQPEIEKLHAKMMSLGANVDDNNSGRAEADTPRKIVQGNELLTMIFNRRFVNAAASSKQAQLTKEQIFEIVKTYVELQVYYHSAYLNLQELSAEAQSAMKAEMAFFDKELEQCGFHFKQLIASNHDDLDDAARLNQLEQYSQRMATFQCNADMQIQALQKQYGSFLSEQSKTDTPRRNFDGDKRNLIRTFIKAHQQQKDYPLAVTQYSDANLAGCISDIVRKIFASYQRDGNARFVQYMQKNPLFNQYLPQNGHSNAQLLAKGFPPGKSITGAPQAVTLISGAETSAQRNP